MVKHIAKFLHSLLIINSEGGCSDQKDVQEILNEAKRYLDIMNEIFPKRICGTNFQTINQVYINLRLESCQWLMNQIILVDKISEEIQPGGLDSCIEMSIKW